MGWAIAILGFDSRRRLGVFLFTTVTRTALGPTQPPIQWVSVALSLGIKRPGCEADHSPPSSADVKNAWSLVKAQRQLYLYIYLLLIIFIHRFVLLPCIYLLVYFYIYMFIYLFLYLCVHLIRPICLSISL
jgi:hypothetical protein